MSVESITEYLLSASVLGRIYMSSIPQPENWGKLLIGKASEALPIPFVTSSNCFGSSTIKRPLTFPTRSASSFAISFESCPFSPIANRKAWTFTETALSLNVCKKKSKEIVRERERERETVIQRYRSYL